MKRWTQSYSSRQVFPLDLKPEQVDLADIPNALAQKVRFGGHTRMPIYSVGQHCVDGARLIAPAFRLPFLLHEVGEVYLPDMQTPYKDRIFADVSPDDSDKREMLTWAELEARHAAAILQALGLSSLLPLLDSPEVKKMDLAMLAAEKRDLLGAEPAPWGLVLEPPANHFAVPRQPEVVSSEWLALYVELTRGL